MTASSARIAVASPISAFSSVSSRRHHAPRLRPHFFDMNPRLACRPQTPEEGRCGMALKNRCYPKSLERASPKRSASSRRCGLLGMAFAQMQIEWSVGRSYSV